MNPRKTKPTKTAAVSAPVPAFTAPTIVFPAVKVPQPDGSVLVKAGKPQVLADEISCAKFARETGLSHSYVCQLCDQGDIVSRPLTPRPRSKRVIPRSEIERFKNLGGIDAVKPSKSTGQNS